MSRASAARGLRSVRAAWRRRRVDAAGLPGPGPERARVPGLVAGADPLPGGGTVRFARSTLLVRVSAGGTVFCGWDGAEPEPSYVPALRCPEADPRAVLEPDKDEGWRVVSPRVTVAVSRHGAVEVRTPGGVVLRRDLPPRWWDPLEASDGRGSRWLLRSEVAADARFFGLGGHAAGPRLRDGSYRLWNTAPAGGFRRAGGLGRAGGHGKAGGSGKAGPGRAGGSGKADDPHHVTMPVLMVVADGGTHLVFHDNAWDGRVRLREGEEGAGSGHDHPGSCELRVDGGPLRSWTVVGPPARVLRGWTSLTGAPALPPSWALGHHVSGAFGSSQEVRRVADGYRERGLPLSALHLDAGHLHGERVFTVDTDRFPDLPALAREVREDGVRLVSVVAPGVKAEPGGAVYEAGAASGAYVRDARGREVRGEVGAGESVYPDFTDPQTRKWWGGLYAERLAQGFSGVWHDLNEPVSLTAFGDPTLPRSARHALEGRGGDHREAHNVYGLAMARAGYEGLRELCPQQRPFLFSRSGWAGMQRYGGAWAGHVPEGWAGLRATLARVLGLGLSGVPYAGADAGAGTDTGLDFGTRLGAGTDTGTDAGRGADGGTAGAPVHELYVRRLQLAAWLPLFRACRGPEGRPSGGGPGAGWRDPWDFGPEVLEHARVALGERQRLLPYFVTLAHLAQRTGAPYVRPAWWCTPLDRALRDCEDAFLLGDALLVAPVLEPGARRRAVRLPRGRWYDTATGDAYEGPGQVLLDTPLSRIPVLARGGAVLPVTGPGGGVELEVWPPAEGRTGGGVVVADAGDGWERARVERYVSRLVDGRVVVERERGGDGARRAGGAGGEGGGAGDGAAGDGTKSAIGAAPAGVAEPDRPVRVRGRGPAGEWDAQRP